jgi:hypothetical protein
VTFFCAGAVYYLQSPDLVAARCVTKTYGIKVYDPHQNRDDVFSTLVKKGTTVFVDQESSPEKVHPVDSHSTSASLHIYVSDFYDNPGYVTEKGCQRVASVYVPIDRRLMQLPGGRTRPPSEYVIELKFKWGGTEVEITAYDTLAQRKVEGVRIQYSADIKEEAPVMFRGMSTRY